MRFKISNSKILERFEFEESFNVKWPNLWVNKIENKNWEVKASKSIYIKAIYKNWRNCEYSV